jgi:uncharacterized membrane protein
MFVSNWKAVLQGTIAAIFATTIWQLNTLYVDHSVCYSSTGCFKVMGGTMFLIVIIACPILLMLPDIKLEKRSLIGYYVCLFGTSTALTIGLVGLITLYGLRNLGMAM